jgi:unsaturated chondroitin disaccharide hydrolase
MIKPMNWPHNTIADNMMNLELLFWAAKNGRPEYYNIAVNHAATTLKHQVRADFSMYHVAVYDTLDGKFLKGVTHQGFADESMWARGQTWGIYGFTMSYRETGKREFLHAAQKLADKYLSMPQLLQLLLRRCLSSPRLLMTQSLEKNTELQQKKYLPR